MTDGGQVGGGARFAVSGTPREVRPRITSLKAAGALGYGQDMHVVPEQEAITQARLVPAMPAILARLLAYREALDRECEERRRNPDVKRADPGLGLSIADYPIGFCRIIRDAVWDRALADPAFIALLGPGVRLRKVFILLKGRYFQNAMQVGNLYVDVANDTVWVHKPKLEWAPVSAVEYRNADAWDSFAEVAQRYLNVTLYPNRLFPQGFPALPFFAIRADGRIELLFAQDILLLKDVGEEMPRSRALLANETWMGRALPEAYETLLRETFGAGAVPGFPLKFIPCSVEALRDGPVADFIALNRKPAEEAMAVFGRYMRIVLAASRSLKQLALAPDAAEIARLRAAGLIPSQV